MKYLVKNLKTMSFSDDSKDLLKNSISDRLSDDSPQVVNATLKFRTDDLIKLVGHQNLVEKLINILSEKGRDETWSHSILSALAHITSNAVWNNENLDIIFCALWPFLFPLTHVQIKALQQIGKSDIAQRIALFHFCLTNDGNIENYEPFVLSQLKNKNAHQGLPQISNVIKIIESIPDKKQSTYKVYYNLLLLTELMKIQSVDHTVGQNIMNLIFKYCSLFKNELSSKPVRSGYETYVCNVYPIQVNLDCIKCLIESIDFSQCTDVLRIDFVAQDAQLNLLIRIFELLIGGLWHEQSLYNDALIDFFNSIFPTMSKRIEFFSNFFIGHLIDNKVTTTSTTNAAIEINPVLQIQAIRIFNLMLEQLLDSTELILTTHTMVCLLTGLAAPIAAIRQCSLETFEILAKNKVFCKKSNWLEVINGLIKRKEEIILDCNQLPLLLCIIFSSKESPASSQKFLNELFEFVGNKKEPAILRASLLDMLKIINNANWLQKIIDPALEILKNVQDTETQTILNMYESKIVKSMLYRFNEKTVDALKLSSNCWEFVRRALQQHNLLLQIKPTTTDEPSLESVSIYAMGIFLSNVFDCLLPKYKTDVIQAVVYTSAYSMNVMVTKSATKLMHRVEIDAKEHEQLLVAMRNADIGAAMMEANTAKRKSGGQQQLAKTCLLSTDILNTNEWKCGVALLEYLQNKKTIKNAHLLIPELFAVLRRCLEFEKQSPAVEYAKQLTLSCILHCCQIISPDGQPKRDLVPDKVFEILLVVQCIRGTQNPQTHHHALQLLTHTAAMIPDLVLHNMMDIFTFVGSSVLRRDDTYTQQIILNIIKSIIPILIKSNEKDKMTNQDAAVIPVLRVFADIILDVPVHRRLRFYENFLITLGAQEFLWMFLVVLFESHVQMFDKVNDRSNTEHAKSMLAKRIDVAIEITNLFDCACVIDTCNKLIEFLYKQPFQKKPQNTDTTMDIDITDSSIFMTTKYSDYQLRQFKYITLQFIFHLTDPMAQFVQRMAATNAITTLTFKPHFKSIIVTTLQFIHKIVKFSSTHSTDNFWRIILSICYDVLNQVLALIYPDMLLQVFGGLLNKNNIPEVRRKAIEVLNKKLRIHGFFETCDRATLLGLLGKFFFYIYFQLIHNNNL